MRVPIFILTVVLMSSSLAFALPPVNTDSTGIAIKGFDPVNYFTQGAPAKGSEEFEVRWMGARWLFTNAEQMELFKADPEKYAPAYGGY